MTDTKETPAEKTVTLRQSPSQKINKPVDPVDKNKAQLIALGADKSSGWGEVEEAHEKASFIIANLDQSLNNVLRKQELEYLTAYNIYVRKKEKDLRNLIFKLHEKNDSSNF